MKWLWRTVRSLRRERFVINRCRPKCSWTRQERPSTNQSNEMCQVALSELGLGLVYYGLGFVGLDGPGHNWIDLQPIRAAKRVPRDFLNLWISSVSQSCLILDKGLWLALHKPGLTEICVSGTETRLISVRSAQIRLLLRLSLSQL